MTIQDMAVALRRSLPAVAVGACVGLAVGGAYLAGGLARATQADAAARQVAVAPSLRGPMAAATFAPTRHAAAVAPFVLRAATEPARDLECLSQAVYYEARGEEAVGRQAVAQVVLNRVRHPRFPKSVCGVVFQHASSGCAFSFACDGQTRRPLETAAWRDARRIAQAALSGFVLHEVGAATDFRGGAGAASPAGLMRVAQIGGHVFYRLAGHWGEAAALTGKPQPSPETLRPTLAIAAADAPRTTPSATPAPPLRTEKAAPSMPVGVVKADAPGPKADAPAPAGTPAA